MVFAIFGLLLMLFPVLLVAAGGLMTAALLRGGAQLRRTGLYYIFSMAGFTMLDALLLKALPWVGVSFGPAWFSLLFLFFARAVFFVLWAGVQVRVGKNNNFQKLIFPFLGVNTLLTLLVVYGFYIEPFQLQTTRVEVNVPAEKLSRPVRIVQISDIHVERTTMREKALVPLVNSLHPDLIVLTGDYLNLSYLHDAAAMQDARELLGQLSAPYGVYAVNGSVDDAERMKNLFGNLDVVVLDNQVAQLNLPGGRLAVIGVTDWGSARDAEMVRSLPASVPDDPYRLLLFHTPDQIEVAVQSGIDLYLAGHTHGGQVRLPLYGALVTFSKHHKKYEAGRYQVGNTTLYVSRGIGMEGDIAPRVRFLAPPEVVVIDLFPGANAKAPGENQGNP